jgi:hypothetical protein
MDLVELTTPGHDNDLMMTPSPAWVGGNRFFVTRRLQNEDVDLAVRSEGGGEQVAVMESSMSSQRRHWVWPPCCTVSSRPPYLAHQLSEGETWLSARGYPSGCRLIDGGSGPKSVCGSSRIELGNPGETREIRRIILVRASGE